jgi:hypothetical protein
MILFYRPELDNPSMDPSSEIGFSFILHDTTEYISLVAGANNDFPEEVWEKIKDYKVVQNLLRYGALRVINKEEQKAIAEAEAADNDPKPTGLDEVSLGDAMKMIEDSYEVDQLQSWLTKESRIKIRNAIAKRIEAIEKGNA